MAVCVGPIDRKGVLKEMNHSESRYHRSQCLSPKLVPISVLSEILRKHRGNDSASRSPSLSTSHSTPTKCLTKTSHSAQFKWTHFPRVGLTAVNVCCVKATEDVEWVLHPPPQTWSSLRITGLTSLQIPALRRDGSDGFQALYSCPCCINSIKLNKSVSEVCGRASWIW